MVTSIGSLRVLAPSWPQETACGRMTKKEGWQQKQPARNRVTESDSAGYAQTCSDLLEHLRQLRPSAFSFSLLSALAVPAC